MHIREATIGRRAVLLGAPALLLPSVTARAAETVRLGVLQFGTVQWVTETIRREQLDARHGFALEAVPLANTEAGRIALMGGRADVVVSDWPFVAVQRAAGTKLSFAPFSTASGGIMVRADSPVRTLSDLKGVRLGVAGGALDKSWLVVQAAGRREGVDLATAATIAYGAPPLLGAKLGQGELDAALTFWNFAAKLEARGLRQAISVGDCAASLGLPRELGLVGFTFREDWAQAGHADPFLAACADAIGVLRRSPDAWAAIRPLMDAPDDATAERLRGAFLAGAAPVTDAVAQERTATQVLAVLRETGGDRATGGLAALPPGVFWPGVHANG